MAAALLLGVALLFIPISGLAYVGLQAAELGNATAIINLARSIGASPVTTFLARQTQSHQVASDGSDQSAGPVLPSDDGRGRAGARQSPRDRCRDRGRGGATGELPGVQENFQFLVLGAVLLIPLIWIALRATKGRGTAATNEYHP